ncbi:MAG TPA: nucleotidyltransferase, partial [Persephonella sp.]|nr:nucleotidyltransferase [Persephonella sp.]
SELEKLLEMVDDRNLTVHTYHEEIAEELLGKLKGYAILMRSVVEGIEDVCKGL